MTTKDNGHMRNNPCSPVVRLTAASLCGICVSRNSITQMYQWPVRAVLWVMFGCPPKPPAVWEAAEASVCDWFVV